ncbi:30S ribosomal protein S4 [candidate division KSB1 bacterium 4572_119]|nr:MAG: 30S ribosomal protein S4 [candidate division KSB1 bacterium 4572_119]
MARYNGPDCKLCRREGQKLFLKGTKCASNKCPFDKKGYAPGQHGRNRRFKQSEYGIQLREKQKVRRIYGILEAQFRNYFKTADGMKGITGENLLKLLESRLDNVVYRLGFAPSRKTARQLIRHRHLKVNDRLVDIPSYNVKAGDIIQVKEKSKKLKVIHSSLRKIKDDRQYSWLSLDKANLTGTFMNLPNREEIPDMINESLIVELYSK